MGMNRGGRGRGGMYNNTGSRGALNQGGGSFRGHNSNRGFGARDNRRGGSFNAGGGQNFPHQQQQQQQQLHQGGNASASFRGRNQGFNHSNRRHDTGIPHGPRDTTSTSTVSGKKDENRRTLTDFKILALEIAEIGWSWGPLPVTKSEVKDEPDNPVVPPPSSEDPSPDGGPSADSAATQPADPLPEVAATSDATATVTSGDVAVKAESVAAVMPPPPSRIRIYFHTPATADDAHPITPQSSFVQGSSSDSGVRKGKRKKLDDDGDMEDGRGPPPPPPGVDHDAASLSASIDYDGSETLAGRDSVAPSIASEGDWLMAAINDDGLEGEGEDEDNLRVDEHLRGGAGGDDDGEPPCLIQVA